MSEAHIDLQLLLQNRSCNVNKEAMLKVFALIARTVSQLVRASDS